LRAADALAAALLLGAVAAGDATAQESPLSRRVAHRVGATVGYSWSNPGLFAGVTQRADLTVVAARASWAVVAGEQNVLEWVVELSPVTVLSGNPSPVTQFGVDRFEAAEGSTWGVGVTPLGLRGVAGVAPGTRLGVDGGLGFIFFSRAVPDALGRGVNFTYALGLTGEVDLDGRRSLVAGYRFLHFSNGHSARINPGVENGVLYVGVLARP
jgi:hypothetical protein